MSLPRIAVPVPTSYDEEYNQRCWPQYAAAVELSGGVAIKLSLALAPGQIVDLAATCSGVVLPGSPADIHPQKYGVFVDQRTSGNDALREAADELLLQDAFHAHKPILGVCYGHQSMNVWKGGTLVQHVDTEVDHAPPGVLSQAHRLAISPLSRQLSACFDGQQLTVNSSHHQAVASAGDGLLPAAWCPEDGTLEAVEGLEGFIVGVQWHPERTFATSMASQRLFVELVAAAHQWLGHARSEGLAFHQLPRSQA